MKKIIALLLVVSILAVFAACGTAEKDSYVVGICQLVQHPALDEATKGFRDALTDALGDKVTFDEQNASNDIPACATIANSFVSKNVDLIMANATPALQACASATTEIPILGTSVTEYGVALSIENFDGTVGGNISGTSDLAPLAEQANMIVELFPDAQSIGLIYCSAEANSLYQVNVVKAELEAKGLTATPYPFSELNDMAAVAEAACATSDVIYVPTDNTVANIPVIAGEEAICAGCGVASLTISYYDLGYKTGEMAAQILKGEAKIEEMPIAYAPNFVKKYNPDVCADLGITPPDDYVPIG